MWKVQDAREGLAALRRVVAAAGTRAQCDHLHGSDPVIRHVGVLMPERALLLFGKMQQQGLEPNVITYSPVISACGKCEMPEKAVHPFK